MTDIVLVDGSRTPHGALLGVLSSATAVELGTAAVDDLISKTGVDPGAIDWVCLGNAIQAGVGQVPARQVVVNANLPVETAATTVNEASGSGLRALALGHDRIRAGRAGVVVAGGMESMSNAPYLVREMRRGRKHGNVTMVDSMIRDALWDIGYDAHMGELTEDLVERFDVSREAQDRYALESHRRAARAIEEGAFDDEIVPVEVDGTTVVEDEGPRPDTDLEGLGRLPTPFREDGTITPGNASDLSDGAGVVLLATDAWAANHGAEPLARVVDYAVSYRDPKWFGMSVSDVVETLLERNDLSVGDVDRFELNEAFAAQMVFVSDRVGIPREKLNVRGGAIAMGHPIGASGGILATTLAHTMRDEDASRGIVGMSVGGGGGIAVLLER